MCFPVKLAKFLRKPFFKEQNSFLKKNLQNFSFPVNMCIYINTEYLAGVLL